MKGSLSAVALAIGVLAVTGCGSGDAGESTSTGSTAPATQDGATGLSAKAQDAVDAAFKGSYGTPPTTAPKPQPGKNIWLVNLSAQFGGYADAGSMVDAAKLLGWKLTMFDGKYSPDTVVSGLRQAVADKADGVIVAFADCASIKAGLEEVRKAHIPVVNIESTDCNEQVDESGVLGDSGQPGLFDSGVGYNNPANPDEPLSFAEFWPLYTSYQALGIIGATGGKAKIIALSESDLKVNFLGLRRFKETLRQYCPGCEIVDTVDFVATDFGPGLQEKVSQALTQHPEANAVYGMYDSPTMDVAPAVMASGRNQDLFVMGGEGTVPVVNFIREGRGVDAGVGYSVRWEAWAALDAMNRLLHGETASAGGFPSGIGAQLFDEERNLPTKGHRFDGSVDFEAAYRKAWGVDGS